ncbi:hypothetical protein ACJX0J_015440, partial [Zea mays]
LVHAGIAMELLNRNAQELVVKVMYSGHNGAFGNQQISSVISRPFSDDSMFAAVGYILFLLEGMHS